MYARLSTIRSNIARAKAGILEIKQALSRTTSKSRETFLKEQLDDENRVLSKLEKAYSEKRKLRK